MNLPDQMKFSVIVGNEDFVVRDHQLHGVRTMPGVTFLDIIYRALAMKGLDTRRMELRDVLFQEPVVTTGDFDQKIQILIEKQAGDWAVKARSQRVKNGRVISPETTENFQCRLRLHPETAQPSRLNIDDIKNRVKVRKDMDDSYLNSRKAGLVHYDFMKLLGQVYIGENDILAEVYLSDLAKQYLGNFHFHPAFLDGALNVLRILTLEHEQELGELKPFIPIYIESFYILGTPREKCLVYIRKPRVTLSASQDISYADLELYDPAGNMIAMYRKFGAKRVRSAASFQKHEQSHPSREETARQSIQTATIGATLQGTPVDGKMDPDQLKAQITTDLREMIAAIQNKPVEQVSVEAGYYDQGLDSGNLLQLVRDLERKLGKQLYPTLLFEYTNIRELAEYLAGEFGAEYGGIPQSSANAIPNHAPAEILYYAPEWQMAEIQRGSSSEIPSGALLVFQNKNASGNSLSRKLAEHDRTIITVEPGRNFRDKGAGRFEINPVKPGDYRRLMAAIQEQGNMPTAIIHQWGGEVTGTDLEAFNSSLQKGFHSLFHISQALIEQKVNTPVRIFHLYSLEDGALDSGDETIGELWPTWPLHAAINGFGKTLSLENPRLFLRTIGIYQPMETDWAGLVLDELQAGADETEVRYENGKRWVKQYHPAGADQQPEPVGFKTGGVYLITGGAGGLGMIIARHLARQYQAKLVLAGRSELSAGQQEEIKTLESLGSQVIYIAADISRRPDVDQLLVKAKERFSQINGVIHAAGVIRDALVINKTAAEMETVLAAKVYGTVHLDQALHNEPLNFFLVFSSSSAVTGNMGQSDYAYANSFLDHYTGFRQQLQIRGMRSGKSLSINWPLWRDGGMQIDAATEAAIRAKLGMVPLEAADGIRALENALSWNDSQLLVIAGEAAKIRRIMGEETAIQDTAVQEAAVRELAVKTLLPTGHEPWPAQTFNHRTDSSQTDNSVHWDEDDIAVIGLAGQYPKARNLEEFWENLKEGRDCISEIPGDRFDWRQYFDPDRDKPGTSYSKWGGFLEDIDRFDPLFFNISPREAEFMDPQERLFMETVWRTLEDAGYTRAELARERVGVYVGVMWGQYQLLETEVDGRKIAPTSIFASIANRISSFYNFSGPSMAVDTMCSSSLTAIHLACESIRRGECGVAVAGGVNLTIHPNKYIFLSQVKLVSSDGRCHSFGADGDGYGPGEGVGAVLLKPLRRAIADGDNIYGVIKSSFINSGGRSGGYMIPNPNAQAALISETLRRSKINPRTISYLEAQAVGTSLGDPIEITGLTKAYREFTSDKQYCAIGTVKSNIGHLESASGIAGVTKVLLQMKYRQLVPSLHSEPASSNIDFANSPFYVQRQLTDWPQPWIEENGAGRYLPRRAGVSAFGAGGANAHVLLEEYISENSGVEQAAGPVLFILSAMDNGCLRAYVNGIKQFLANHRSEPRISLSNIAYTLQIGREAMEERLAVIVSDLDQLLQKLTEFEKGRKHISGLFHDNIHSESAKSGVLFDGKSGAEFLKMIIENRELDKIARLWVSGVEVDWRLLYQGANPYIPHWPRRISLPTYPFVKKRYWITDGVEDTILEEPAVQDPALESGATAADIQNRLEQDLIQILSKLLKIPAESIRADENLKKYGFDSLAGVRTVNALKSIYGSEEITVRIFFENSSIREIAAHLIENQIIVQAPGPVKIPGNQPTRVQNPVSPLKKLKQEQAAAGSFRKRFYQFLLAELRAGTISPKQALAMETAILAAREDERGENDAVK